MDMNYTVQEINDMVCEGTIKIVKAHFYKSWIDWGNASEDDRKAAVELAFEQCPTPKEMTVTFEQVFDAVQDYFVSDAVMFSARQNMPLPVWAMSTQRDVA